MPSDCMCSSACACETRVVEKVIGSKEAGAKIRRLEKEVEELKRNNASLKRKLEKASANKREIVKKLKKKLDEV